MTVVHHAKHDDHLILIMYVFVLIIKMKYPNACEHIIMHDVSVLFMLSKIMQHNLVHSSYIKLGNMHTCGIIKPLISIRVVGCHNISLSSIFIS